MNKTRYGKEISQTTEDDTVVAGQWSQRVIDKQGIHLGYTDDPFDGIRPIPLTEQNHFRHILSVGTTGYGKSTQLVNTAVQAADEGHGVVYIDPKGDVVEKLYRRLPAHRMDDVRWIDTGRDTDGFNFLQPTTHPEHEGFTEEVGSLIDELERVLATQSTLGVRQSDLLRTVVSELLTDPTQTTLEDLYTALSDKSQLEQLSQTSPDPNVVDSLLRRLRPFINRPVRHAAFDDSGVSPSTITEDTPILLLQLSTASDKQTKQHIGRLFLGWVWNAIKQRQSMPPDSRPPLTVMADEYEFLANENDILPEALSKGRSLRSNFTVSVQSLDSLPTETKQGLLGNCDNLLAFNPTTSSDANQLTARLNDDIDRSDILNQSPFEYRARLINRHGEAVTVPGHTFPMLPPRREPHD